MSLPTEASHLILRKRMRRKLPFNFFWHEYGKNRKVQSSAKI